MRNIIDTPFDTTNKLSSLAAQGIQTIIRYYNFSNSQTFPDKCLQLAEAQAISAQGIRIAVVFQQRQTKAEDFSEQKGFAAGQRAYRYAHDNIGQPDGSGIYFSVDFDASVSEITNNIIPFFEGIKRAFATESGGSPIYRVGVYGSGAVSAALSAKGLISLTWLSMSHGFSGTKDALRAGQYNLAQFPPATKLCGLGVDFNEQNPNNSDFGAFTIDSEETSPHAPSSLIGEKYKVIARSGLRLREGAGTEFDVVGSLSFGQIVYVTSITNGWARVDIEGDGQIDGFASAGY